MHPERILTQHPAGKKGVNILKSKYDQVAKIILEIIRKNGEISFEELSDTAKKLLLEAKFDGKPLWYIVTVKLDLEARGMIERIPKSSPHRLRMANN